MQNKGFSTNKTLNVRGKLVDLSIPRIMGILNVTPDSFFDGSRYTDSAQALRQVEKMMNEGATFIDIGGYSSRPGATDISVEEEVERTAPMVKLISKAFPEAIISIDTFRAVVARKAVEEGAAIINDISGGDLDADMFTTVADLQVPYILMHMRGTPQTMKELSHYDLMVKDLIDYFHQRVYRLQALGVKDIIIDPGFGFAKNTEQNFELLNHLEDLAVLGLPLLAGLSRKSMIWKTLNETAATALNGTTSLNTVALIKGAAILRVHDVKEAADTVKLIEKLKAK
ncbi:MAG: dihydropteroate synthase [Azospira oryzae]|jgi:dihydropteroate synthase|nr:MAG: dihydropteroate synthase [Azospira oryzae]